MCTASVGDLSGDKRQRDEYADNSHDPQPGATPWPSRRACHICWDMPAGLKGSASKPLPGSGHITGGVQSLSDSTGVVSTRRRFFELPISATLRHRTYAELGTRVRLASRFRESRLKVGP